jgi:hypothetical protein
LGAPIPSDGDIVIQMRRRDPPCMIKSGRLKFGWMARVDFEGGDEDRDLGLRTFQVAMTADFTAACLIARFDRPAPWINHS